MILFCSAAHFNESVNAFGMVESAELGRISTSLFIPALMFNYHKFVVFLFVLFFPLSSSISTFQQLTFSPEPE